MGLKRLSLFLLLLGALQLPWSAYADSLAEKLQLVESVADPEQKLALLQQYLADGMTSEDELILRERIGKLLFSMEKWPEATASFARAEVLARELNNPEAQARQIKMQGVISYYQGHFMWAVSAYQKGLALIASESGSVNEANLLNNIGLAYFRMYDLPQALAYYHQARKMYDVYGDEKDRADILANLAIIYNSMGRYETALDMFQQSIRVFEKLDFQEDIARANGNMGVAYKRLNQLDMAEGHYKQALEYYTKVGSVKDQASTEINLSNLNARMGRYVLAKEWAELALGHANVSQDEALVVGAYHCLGSAQFGLHEFDEAAASFERSIALAKELNEQLRLRDGLILLSLVESARGNPANALDLFVQHETLRDELSYKELTTSLNEFQAQFEVDDLSRQLEELKLQQRYDGLAARQRLQVTLTFSGVAILALIVGFTLYQRSQARRQKRELEETVAKRTRELELLTEELSRANKVKSQFLANMSHEFRTPLTSIMGQAEAIISRHFEPDELLHELQIIYNNSAHLASLINDVLDLSKIEANKLELNLSQVSLPQLLSEVEAMFQSVAEQKGIVFRLDGTYSPYLSAKLDAIRVKQVLINLCSNAVKFTSHGVVRLRLEEQQSGICFIIHDTGIGIKPEQLKEIFKCFSQGDNSISRIFGGTGLGLSLSQQLATMMGGYIHVASKPGEGSEFSFYIPCQTTESYLPETPLPQHPDSKGPLKGSVLLAEDHDDNRRLITRVLQAYGLEVYTAANGKQAVEICLVEHPDLVLMDIQMPEMDGIEALTLLRQAGFNEPVFALTANALSHEVAQYQACGFTGHLSKPLDQEHFYQTLANYLSQEKESKYADIEKVKVDTSDLEARFLSELEREKNDLAQAFAQQDMSQLRALSHRLAGAAELFGFKEIGTTAKQVELAIKQQRFSDVNGDLACLFKAIDDCRQNSSTSPS